MAQLLQNRWHLRRVADTSAKSCLICYKPSTSVLVTPDNEEEVAAKKRKEEMDREIEKVKKQYEEKQRRKRDKEKDGEKTDDKKKADDEEESKKAEKERDDKIKSIQNAASPLDASTDDMPRIYSLHKNFYQMRVDRLKAIEKSKRDRQRLQNPSTFPSVPKTDLS